MIKDIMQEIESKEFCTHLSVTSSFRGFLRAAYEEQATQDLIKELIDAPINTWYVLQRVTELSRQEIDTRYENPWDTALTIYVWALSLIKLEIAQTAAAFVVNAQNGWWATRFANSLLQKKELTNVSCLDTSSLEKLQEVRDEKVIRLVDATQKITVTVNPLALGTPKFSTAIYSIKNSRKTGNVLQGFLLTWSTNLSNNSPANDCPGKKECNTSC